MEFSGGVWYDTGTLKGGGIIMILAIDIGNTNIVLGCGEGKTIAFRERISTKHTATDLDYAVAIKTALEMNRLDPSRITGAILSSVVPGVTNTFRQAVEKYLGVKPLVVGPGIKTGLSIRIDNPAQLGSDLVVESVAAIQEYAAPMVIVDMSTATTFSVIDKNRNYLGGLITTGLAVSADALVSRTSQLPRVSFDPPKRLIGANTVDCIRSGLMYSTAAAIDGIVERIRQELGSECTVIATGEPAHLVAPLCKTKLILDDDLLLKGLLLIYQRNTER